MVTYKLMEKVLSDQLHDKMAALREIYLQEVKNSIITEKMEIDIRTRMWRSFQETLASFYNQNREVISNIIQESEGEETVSEFVQLFRGYRLGGG